MAMNDDSSDENYSNVDPELEGSTSILDLPPEVIINIVNYLDLKGTLEIGEVSTYFELISRLMIKGPIRHHHLQINLEPEYNEKNEQFLNFLIKILPEKPILKINLKNIKHNTEYFQYFLKCLGSRISSFSFQQSFRSYDSKQMQYLIEAIENGYLTNLVALDLSREKLGFRYELNPEDIKSLLNVIKYVPNLKELYLAGNIIGPEGAALIAEAAKNGYFAKFQKLNLSNNGLDPVGIKDLLIAIQYMPDLKELYLADNIIGQEGSALIAEAAKNGYFAKLQTLNLSNNELDYVGIKDLLIAIQYILDLKELYLAGNIIGPKGAALIAEAAKNGYFAKLQTLNLSNSQLGHKGFQIFLNCVTFMQLEKLYLASNKIGYQGMAYLKDAPQKFLKYLQILDLNGNEIGSKGLKNFLAVARLMKNLQSLHLALNNIDSKWIRDLNRFPCIQILDLRENNLGYNGLRELSKYGGDKFIQNIKELHLMSNNIGPKGIEHLKEFVNLITIDLRENNLGDGGFKNLSNIVDKLTNLKIIYLNGNDISDQKIKKYLLNFGDIQLFYKSKRISKVTYSRASEYDWLQ